LVGTRKQPRAPQQHVSVEKFMSGFMTITGPFLDLSDLKPIELLEASRAQFYIQKFELELASKDGTPVYLVHDGFTDTSDEFTGEAWNALQLNESIEGTLLLTLIKRFIANGNSFRIWYAGNDPSAHLDVEDCFSLDDIMRVTSHSRQIQIRYLNKNR
jgi:hypothetical protein